MTSIQLIVTGDAEKRALAPSLAAALPRQRQGVPVVWADPIKAEEPAKGRLRPLTPHQSVLADMAKLADLLVATVQRGPTGRPPDLVLVIGDVELNNLGQEQLLVDHLRHALRTKLGTTPAPPLRAALAQRCSYHLFRPMLEAPFFGSTAALAALGIPAGLPQLAARDVEDFECTDAAWVSQEVAKRGTGTPWWRPACHAKRYLSYLRQQTVGRPYRETKDGPAALQALNWPQAVDREASPFLRALFDDLADWFGQPSPLQPSRVTPGPPLAPTHPHQAAAQPLLLRNL